MNRIQPKLSPRFGKDFRDVRLSRHYTYNRTAKALDVAATSIHNAEQGLTLSSGLFLMLCAWADLDANRYKPKLDYVPIEGDSRQQELFKLF